MTEKKINKPHPGSFRDPAGRVFIDANGKLSRVIYETGKDDYEFLMRSGLYSRLVEEGLLIPHQEARERPESAHKIIFPSEVDFISYPSEWCFSQLKDAALIQLKILELALQYKMILKDGSAYNMQFYKGHPVLIDTLSFTAYTGPIWNGYLQFCRHFLAPLCLMSLIDPRLGLLHHVFPDGIPLDLARNQLSFRGLLHPGIATHIVLHSLFKRQNGCFNKQHRKKPDNLFAIIDDLKRTLTGLNLLLKESDWSDYEATETEYRNAKSGIIREILAMAKPTGVWDLGANIGSMSRIVGDVPVLAIDSDHSCVEKNYRLTRENKEKNILPLVIDLFALNEGGGWQGNERLSLFARGPVDTVLALALIHHLVFMNNLPLEMIRDFFAGVCEKLVIEFVPPDDPLAEKMSAGRTVILNSYNERNFEKIFSNRFRLILKRKIPRSNRAVYFFQKI